MSVRVAFVDLPAQSRPLRDEVFIIGPEIIALEEELARVTPAVPPARGRSRWCTGLWEYHHAMA
jgi:hypothetical protein